MDPTRPPTARLMRKLELEPDPWQMEVLDSPQRQLLLNCCRQAGKSTVVAALAMAEALWNEGTQVLLLSPAHRQSLLLLRKVLRFFDRLGSPIQLRRNREELRLKNESSIVALPCREETIRGYSNVNLLIIDEASRVPDDLYRAVRPMLATSQGRLICLSTPYGKRGFFYDCWANGGADWHRVEVPATQIPRITPAFLEQEQRSLGQWWYRQEYCCSFEALEGLVYPDFARCVVAALPAHVARERVKGQIRYGGIDFGFRNPFAALWGVLDRDGVLWLTGERYSRERSIQDHAGHLPRDVTWYADPSGAEEISQLKLAGFTVRTADNAIRPGIAAVRARLENGTLRVLQGACPNLLAEAALYRYETERGSVVSENPKNEQNHALDALRYLVSRLDARLMARFRKRGPSAAASPQEQPPASEPAPPPQQRAANKWLRYSNEELWTRLD
jgi:hypothetical protein